jgi:hypothetical protein
MDNSELHIRSSHVARPGYELLSDQTSKIAKDIATIIKYPKKIYFPPSDAHLIDAYSTHLRYCLMLGDQLLSIFLRLHEERIQNFLSFWVS